MKAAQDLEERKPDNSGLAFLDPKQTKVKGWSKDPDVVIADIERMGDRALIFCDWWSSSRDYWLCWWYGDGRFSSRSRGCDYFGITERNWTTFDGDRSTDGAGNDWSRYLLPN